MPLANARLADGTFFSEHWAVSILPGGGFLRESSDMKSERKLLVVSAEENREDLTFALREGEAIGAHLATQSKKLLSGSQASLAATLELMRNADFVHLSCHGHYEAMQPQFSGPTSHFQLCARLVFLSCCESGISGRTIPPDEFVGLLPSFLQCGARGTIGALWPVYDDAAMLLSQNSNRLLKFAIFLDTVNTPSVGNFGRPCCSTSY